MEAIILAGGLGTRLRAVVPDLPKPMAPINGRPFLEFLLDYWGAQGISRAVLSVGYKADLIISHFGNAYHGMAIGYTVEATPCGTGGGLVLATKQLASSGTFLVVNGDTFFEVDLADMVRTHRARGAKLTMALVEQSAPDRYQPVGLGGDGRIVSLQAKDTGSARCLVNGGVYLFEPHLLMKRRWASEMVLSLERDMLPKWLMGGDKIFGYVGKGRFLDIGIPNDYAAAGALVSGQRYGTGSSPQTW